MAQTLTNTDIIFTVNKITSKRTLYKLAKEIGMVGYRGKAEKAGLVISTVKNEISSTIIRTGINPTEVSPTFNEYINAAGPAPVKGRPSTKQEAIARAVANNVDIGSDKKKTAKEINSIIDETIARRGKGYEERTIEEVNRIYGDRWKLTYTEKLIKNIHSIFGISPLREEPNKFVPVWLQWRNGKIQKMLDSGNWTRDNFVLDRYDEMVDLLEAILVSYKSRVKRVFKFKLWQQILNKLDNGTYSVLTTNIKQGSEYGRFESFDKSQIREMIQRQLSILLDFTDESMSAYIEGSTFTVALYSPIRLDIILEEPEDGRSLAESPGLYIPIPREYSKKKGIINIVQDAEWCKDKCFLLCVGFSRFIKDNNVDAYKFNGVGGLEIPATCYEKYLRKFVEENEAYSHIDKYQKMIENKYPSMVINIFYDPEKKGTDPLIYRRFDSRESYKPENEINLLISGDIENAFKDTMMERSHVFLLLDPDNFFRADANKKDHTFCRNCGMSYNIEVYKTHYSECVVGNVRNIRFETRKPIEKTKWYKNEDGDWESEVVMEEQYKCFDEYYIDEVEEEEGTHDEFISSLYIDYKIGIPYKRNKHRYLMSADFETDLKSSVNGKKEMYDVQFGVAGSYDDKFFGYVDNKDGVNSPFDEIFKMATDMAYHNHNSRLYNDYYGGYDGPLSIGEYYWYMEGHDVIYNEEVKYFNEYGVKLIDDLELLELTVEQKSALKKWNLKNYKKIPSIYKGKIYVPVADEHDSEKVCKEKFLDYKEKLKTRYYHKNVLTMNIEIPLFFLNGINFDNTLLLRNLDLKNDWEIGNCIASSATNFKQFEFVNKYNKIKIKVMDLLSFKNGSLAKTVEAYHSGGKDFAIMKLCGMDTFHKMTFPYSVNNMHNDTRTVDKVKYSDFVMIGDNYSVYRDDKADEIFAGLTKDDYDIIDVGMTSIKKLRKIDYEDYYDGCFCAEDLLIKTVDERNGNYSFIIEDEEGRNGKNGKEDKDIVVDNGDVIDKFVVLLKTRGIEVIEKLYNIGRDKFIESVGLYSNSAKDKVIDKKKLIERRDNFLKVANEVGLVTLKDVAWYYLKCDILQLLECSRFYMDEIFEQSGLNPYSYVSSHAHGFDWGLKKSGLKYYYLQDPDYYRELKSKCYGGLSCTYTRSFKSDLAKSTIFEFDATSMYPSCMLGGLPTRLDSIEHVDICDSGEISNVIDDCYNDRDYIYLLKVDTSYDPSKYETLWKFPPRVTQRLFDKNGNLVDGVGKGHYKLTNDLLPSKDDIYEVDYLNYMIGLGLVVDRVTRIDRYERTDCVGGSFIEPIAEERSRMKTLGDYCEMSEDKRDSSVLKGLTDGEIDMINNKPGSAKIIYGLRSDSLKLTMNSFYGKSIENVEDRSDNKIVDKIDKLSKAVSSPLFVEYNVLNYVDEDPSESTIKPLYFVKRKMKKVTLDKPIFIGKVILDRAKMALMKFVHDELFRVYGVDRVHIGCTDTDSIHVMIDGERTDIYNDFSKFNCVMDNSKVKVEVGNYVRDDTYAGKLGSWKNEGAGVNIERAYYHRAKAYCEEFDIEDKDKKYHAKAKGIPKDIIKGNAEKLFFPGDDGARPLQFKCDKIGKDHKEHKMQIMTVKKKMWGKEEDKVFRNSDSGEYRPWGTKELITRAIINGTPRSMEWKHEYERFSGQSF